MADSYLDHAGMIARIREDMTAGQLLGQREQRGIIGHVARGEHQPRLYKQISIKSRNVNPTGTYSGAEQSWGFGNGISH
jgi:hypothetical protein